MILSLAMMLKWLGNHRGDMQLRDASHLTEIAVDQVLNNSNYWTRDLGGSAVPRNSEDTSVSLSEILLERRWPGRDCV